MQSHQLETLSFATVAQGGTVDLWPTVPNADYAEACTIGRERATELVEYMRTNEAPNVLGHVYVAMQVKGTFGGAEIGFTQVIAESALN